jgi:hypothetical protein
MVKKEKAVKFLLLFQPHPPSPPHTANSDSRGMANSLVDLPPEIQVYIIHSIESLYAVLQCRLVSTQGGHVQSGLNVYKCLFSYAQKFET